MQGPFGRRHALLSDTTNAPPWETPMDADDHHSLADRAADYMAAQGVANPVALARLYALTV